MNRVNGAGPHPSEGDVIRYLDAELSEAEEHRFRKHLGVCAECAARAEAFAREGRAASRVLAELPAPGPDAVTRARALAAVRRVGRRRRAPGTAHRHTGVAAAAVALLAIGMGVQPVRAWVADWWSSLARPDGESPPAVVARPAAAPGEQRSVVAFEPSHAPFVLRIDQRQRAGSLRLEVLEVERASAQIHGGSEETILVLPAGIRVENAPESAADYVVTLPATLPEIEVVIGGETVARIEPAAEQTPWSREFPLGRGAAR